jgi:hypothetical protein
MMKKHHTYGYAIQHGGSWLFSPTIDLVVERANMVDIINKVNH